MIIHYTNKQKDLGKHLMCFLQLQIDFVDYKNNSVKATIQILIDAGLIDDSDQEGEILKDYVSLDKK